MLKRKSKTHIPCVLFIFLIWTALWSCRSQSPESFATGSGDGPLRIISTMPSTTEMLYEFGVWEQVAAISSHCESPPGQAVKPVVGTGFEPDLEQILDLQADLVVGSVVQQNAPFIGELERLGIPHHLVADQTLEDLLLDMPRLGRAVGAEQAAQEAVNRIHQGLSELAHTTAELQPLPVLMVYGQGPIYAAGPESFMGPIIEIAGGRNVLTEGAWVELDTEAVVALSPAVILVPSELSENALGESWRSYEQIPAVREGRVYPVRSDSAHHPGPGLVEVAQEILHLVNSAREQLASEQDIQEEGAVDGR